MKSEAFQETIARAVVEVDKLARLLEDAHPGLMTWIQAVDKQAGIVAWVFGYNPQCVAQNTPNIEPNPVSDLDTLKKLNLIRGL